MEEVRDRIIERMSDAESPILREGVELAVDHALAQKLNMIVDPEETVKLIQQLVAGENVGRFIERHVNPARRRLLKHFRQTEETPEDLTPEGTRERVETILRNGDFPRAGWASGAIERQHVRALLAPVIQEVLLAFTRKLPIPGNDGNGKRSSKKKRGFGFGSSIMDIGKGVLGDLQERFQDIAKEFSSQAMNDARDAAVDQIASKDGQQALREMRDSLIDRFMVTKVIALLEDTERLPIENLLDLAPDIADHNRVRKEFKDFIGEEVNQIMDIEGERSIRELLEENGLLDDVREQIIEEAIRQTSEVFASKPTSEWLDKLLKE